MTQEDLSKESDLYLSTIKKYETDRLESTDFNYEAIINRLMDMLIIQP